DLAGFPADLANNKGLMDIKNPGQTGIFLIMYGFYFINCGNSSLYIRWNVGRSSPDSPTSIGAGLSLEIRIICPEMAAIAAASRGSEGSPSGPYSSTYSTTSMSGVSPFTKSETPSALEDLKMRG